MSLRGLCAAWHGSCPGMLLPMAVCLCLWVLYAGEKRTRKAPTVTGWCRVVCSVVVVEVMA